MKTARTNTDRVTPGECLDLLHSTLNAGTPGLFNFERLIDLIVRKEEDGPWT